MLHSEVPLIGDRRLHVGIPHAQESARVACISRWIAGRARCRTWNADGRVRSRQCLVVVDGIDFGWREGSVQSQSEVGSGSFQIRRNCEGSADYRMAAKSCRRPGEPKAWLKVPAAVEPVVEASASALFAGEINVAGKRIEISLFIVRFNPRGVRLVAQADIQRQVVRDSPRVLRINPNDIARLFPGFAGADTSANLKRQPEHEVSSAVSGIG